MAGLSAKRNMDINTGQIISKFELLKIAAKMQNTHMIIAKSEADFETARQLFQEYADTLETDLCFQGFQQELASLPKHYGAPMGVLLLLQSDNNFVGCGGLRSLEPGVGEIKRLYLRKEARGKGWGRKLLEEIIQIARTKHYQKLRLDTLPSMQAAIDLYHSFGFYEISAYRFNPVEGVKYFQLDLV
jgi:ribosomal protein S18 acetylase RimI-like enzyme